MRLYRLHYPNEQVFDEFYYANQAAQYLIQGVERPLGVHPPVGKWMIAGGIEVFGFSPFGWRVVPALAGTATVAVVYLIARRLLASRWAAVLAALLVAVDGLAFTMSRIAMLDVFVALFVAAGFLFLVVDARRQREKTASFHWWWAAGAAFGLGFATKWSAAPLLVAGIAFAATTELVRRRADARRSIRRALLHGLGAFVLLPAGIYVASYVPWFAHYSETRAAKVQCEAGECDPSFSDKLSGWVDEQGDIVRFHRDLRTDHRESAPATTWPLLQRPVTLGEARCPSASPLGDRDCSLEPGHGKLILAVGNPVLWWAALPSLALLGWETVRRRWWPAAAIVGFVLAQWLPWVMAERREFLFYAVPIVPFLALAAAAASERVAAVRRLRWVPVGLALSAVAMFVFLYPILTGVDLRFDEIDRRLLLDSWR